MRSPHWQLGVPEGVILFGASIFILVLGVSAFWEPDIRWLHFFQSWMYLATIALSLRGNRWGYFIGISAAGLWDYINIFATTFFCNGLHQARTFLRAHNGLFRPSHRAVPATLSRDFPPTIAPALSVRNLLGKNQIGWESTQASGQRLI